MSVKNIVMAAAGAATGKTYIEDVFSTYIYDGNNSTQTVNNGIDLAGKGGMVWLKGRNGTNSSYYNHAITDTTMSKIGNVSHQYLLPNSTNGITSYWGDLKNFNSNGFTIGWDGSNSNTTSQYNPGGGGYVSWTFRKAPKFFDVVRYTGNGSSNRAIAHSLGCQPGMVVVKNLSASSHWQVRHYGTETGSYLPTGYWSSRFNQTLAFSNTGLVRTSLTG